MQSYLLQPLISFQAGQSQAGSQGVAHTHHLQKLSQLSLHLFNGKSRTPPPLHYGLVLPYGPATSRASSAEVKRFVEARKPARPGTVQVMVVLRTLN